MKRMNIVAVSFGFIRSSDFRKKDTVMKSENTTANAKPHMHLLILASLPSLVFGARWAGFCGR